MGDGRRALAVNGTLNQQKAGREPRFLFGLPENRLKNILP
jgi:hypothetical protein